MHNPPGIQDRPVLPVRAEGPRSSAICLLRAAEAAPGGARAGGAAAGVTVSEGTPSVTASFPLIIP